jgi:hypothetical protein
MYVNFHVLIISFSCLTSAVVKDVFFGILNARKR